MIVSKKMISEMICDCFSVLSDVVAIVSFF